MRAESFSVLILIFAVAMAIFMTNIHYFAPIYLSLAPAKHLVNNGLMALFFTLVGLEIKREILTGELSSIKQASLPVIAALGGVVIPPLLYLFSIHTLDENPQKLINGWAIPAATDIAFALGVMMVLGKRVPKGLKLCLAMLAIVDDLFAIIVIAIFYSSDLNFLAICATIVIAILLFLMNRKAISSLKLYLLAGGMVWISLHYSGIEPTIAGIILAIAIPSGGLSKKLEHVLRPLSLFVIMPVFAFMNSDFSFNSLGLESLLQPLTLSIIISLFFGKQIGVMLFSFIAIRCGVCQLPPDSNWKSYYGMAVLTGIGFTMSLFIGTLAFHEAESINAIKLGVGAASLTSGIFGYILLRASR